MCKSASKPVISSFYCPKTPLHLNGRLNAQVESDIVGYTTVTIKPGYNMVAVNFDNLGEDASISIQDLFPGSEGGVYTAGSGAANADKIMVWDTSEGEYKTYFLFKAARGTSERNYKWVDADAATVVSNKTFSSGDSFWYYSRATADFDVTIKGLVATEDKQEIGIAPGYNMIGSCFPANFNPNTFDAATWQASGAVAGAGAANADKIMVWDATKGEYKTYILFKAARGTSERDYKWVDADAAGVAVDATAEVLPSAKGAWYFHRGDGFTMTINSPIAE